MKLTQQEKKEGLCAEFMGLVPCQSPYLGAYTIAPSIVPDTFINLFHSELEEESWYLYPKFSTDWNWAMELLKKIGSLTGEYVVGNRSCAISFTSLGNEPWYADETVVKSNEDPLKAVFEACVKFIEWYNGVAAQ